MTLGVGGNYYREVFGMASLALSVDLSKLFILYDSFPLTKDEFIHFLLIWTVSLALPLALLLFRTFLPALVLILSRKPWVRFRFILLG